MWSIRVVTLTGVTVYLLTSIGAGVRPGAQERPVDRTIEYWPCTLPDFPNPLGFDAQHDLEFSFVVAEQRPGSVKRTSRAVRDFSADGVARCVSEWRVYGFPERTAGTVRFRYHFPDGWQYMELAVDGYRQRFYFKRPD